jgi:eukaryotic-like serine/threonine-protein kinase
MKKYIDFFISKKFLLNLGIIVLITIVGFFIFKFWLISYTDHNEKIEVPNFINMDFAAAQAIAAEKNLELKIIDTVYSKEIKPGAIVNHKPLAKTFVKEHRVIYISINSRTPILVKMPNATNVSLRQATQELESCGLIVGTIVYKPDFADNYVFEQRYNNRMIRPGVKIPKGSRIDFVVGKGGDNLLIPIPNLIGMSYQQVKDSMSLAGVTINFMFGGEVFETLDDSIKAVVWKQTPISENGNMIMAGETIDIWLTNQDQQGNE